MAATAESTSPPALELRGISKRFETVDALVDAQLRLRAGEIHALMGQNGAGKSTLIKVLTGVLASDAGEMHMAGEPIRPSSPLDAQRLGISTVYQEVNLCPNLSVAENIFAGRYPRCGAWQGFRIDWSAHAPATRELLARRRPRDRRHAAPLRVLRGGAADGGHRARRWASNRRC